MEEVEFEVDIERSIFLVPVASNILNVLKKKAKSQGISTETMINILLQQHTLILLSGLIFLGQPASYLFMFFSALYAIFAVNQKRINLTAEFAADAEKENL